jgi:hypothetical protein
MPAFTGDAEQVALAEVAWAAATACARREAQANERVELVKVGEAEWTAHAVIDAGGLAAVQLTPSADARSLVHELAHAWVDGGPAALREGRADLLVDCVAASVPGVGPRARSWNPSAIPDLRSWEHRGGQDADVRAAAYGASAALIRAAARVLPPQALFRTSYLGWAGLEELLVDAGPAAEPVLAVLRGGSAAQRQALSDADGDGVTVLEAAVGAVAPGAGL